MNTTDATCKNCGVEKSLDNFTKTSQNVKTGKIYYKKICKPCTSKLLMNNYEYKHAEHKSRGRLPYHLNFPDNIPLIKYDLEGKVPKCSIYCKYSITAPTLNKLINSGIV